MTLNESTRLAFATKKAEIAMRKVWLAGIDKEIAGEIKFLADRGIVEPELADMSDDELLAALTS